MRESLPPRDRRLIAAAERGLPLVDHPFAALGEPLALAEDEVIERLRGWLAQGWLAYLGPQFAGPPAPRGALEEQLVDATRSGVPLVPRPFEALGAMLGVDGQAVLGALMAMIASGRLLRIAAQHGAAMPPGA